MVAPPGDSGERPPADGLAAQPDVLADLVGPQLQPHLLPPVGEDPRLLGRHCGGNEEKLSELDILGSLQLLFDI